MMLMDATAMGLGRLAAGDVHVFWKVAAYYHFYLDRHVKTFPVAVELME